MPKVSIIIPVYNARDSIARCLDSVLAQTLDDIEAVLVDDHGPDDSIEVAKAFLADYDGPKAFCFTRTPVNSGPGAARNVGMEQATGEFLAFLDSDDTLEPDFCEALYSAASAAGADMAFGHISFDMPDGSSVVKHNPLVPDGLFEGRVKKRYLSTFTSYFTTYLYRRTMLLENGITFPCTRSAEDSCFLICSLLCARRIACVDKVLYHYDIQPSSVSKRRDRGRARQRFDSFLALKAFAKAHGLWRPYGTTLRFIIFKKGWLLAVKDLITG